MSNLILSFAYDLEMFFLSIPSSPEMKRHRVLILLAGFYAGPLFIPLLSY
jgi:hypothetical protein